MKILDHNFITTRYKHVFSCTKCESAFNEVRWRDGKIHLHTKVCNSNSGISYDSLLSFETCESICNKIAIKDIIE